MNKLLIQGGVPLKGEVRISGAKNAILPIMAGALLADAPVVIENVPHLMDVTTMMELLGGMGVQLMLGDRMSIHID
ncbi:MAG TPA: UDP-N-acetylglucosamine 1-carboxyvinyltransferase, partial [bacterium]|nr:UDP-N-acetylglucosamine 1-carboxyvinyltransferase [bacterium]